RVAGVVAPHDVPVLLHEERVRARRAHRDAVHAVADLTFLVRELGRAQPLIDRAPGLAAVVGAKRARRGDRNGHPARVVGVDQDRVETEAAGARLPLRAGRVIAQARELLPVLAAVSRTEERGVLDAGVDRVGVVKRRLEMPDAGELPWMLRPVVPLVRA